MNRNLTFLFAPIEAVGHFNACIGIGQQLLTRGHKVVFATPNSWKGKLIPLGFKEEYYQDDLLGEDESTEKWGEIIAAMAPALALPTLQKMEFLHFAIYQEVISKVKANDERLREIMDVVSPDLVLVDNVAQTPSLTCQGVPWILSASVSPLGISSKNVPPAFTGYPIDGDEAVWKQYTEKQEEVFRPLFEDFNAWVIENGGRELKYIQLPFWLEYSPYANIYMYPQELDYTTHRPDPANWHRFDSFVREDNDMFEIPKELENLPGKLIYVSLGSIGCSEMGLMRRLVEMLANSPNRFIFSKGSLGDQLVLAPNMWGEIRIPQTNVLPLVDLVITHGGNNTVTESFYFGKRMIILPLFCDQLDNGQRVEETGLGIQFQPYQVTQEELLDGIERMLADELLEERMVAISKRMQSSKSQEKAAELIESVAFKHAHKIQPSMRHRMSVPNIRLDQASSQDGSRRSSLAASAESVNTINLPPFLSNWARRRSDAQ